ncbi:DegT/DnrJ/EryC1/StrS aminotransferase family protein [Saccharomonospora sp. NB11]|uniref:DegT/DnrJ/EryC1/StrS family aminotransferase n=1 Tax=Saccharomonospora sp. NB11 TaxID=1642298 RepID=UPI0018D1502F|nr:DegT/DnrJ/EryC1/StrS family aminotransferase [Saccharomonospora sp. NB11]
MTAIRNSSLALFGGTPVHDRSWPTWPEATSDTLDMLREAALSGRWAITGAYTGVTGFERRFATAFADYHGVPHAVPTTNGSAALTIAMEALGVGPGTEVIVPGLTWVACASAAASLGAVPVLVDVDPATLSISPAAAEAAITDRTRAILVVHAYCSSADINALTALSRRTGIPIVEDCSQAHGAEWNGRKVGTFGTLGVFSLQQTKVLTCGEGGVVITSSDKLHDQLQQYRANGRRYTAKPAVGQLELEEAGTVEGHNHAMSEFHAAVALSQLPKLDEQNALRNRNAGLLAGMLAEIPGVSVVPAPPQLTSRTYYDHVIRLDPEQVGPFSIHRIVDAMTAELNLFFETLDAPLNANPLYVPLKSPRLPRSEQTRRAFDPTRFDLPNATAAYHTCFAFLHHALLGSEQDVAAIAEAVRKVVDNIDQLRPEAGGDR